MDNFPITKEGHDSLVQELKRLKTVERPEVIRSLSEARDHGDISENAEYHAAKERQAFIEGRVAELEDKLRRAQVIDPKTLSGKTIKFGATVRLCDEDTDERQTYTLVGAEEGDIGAGRLSVTSPLGRALIGKKKGDNVEVTTPKGSKAYEILNVRYK